MRTNYIKSQRVKKNVYPSPSQKKERDIQWYLSVFGYSLMIIYYSFSFWQAGGKDFFIWLPDFVEQHPVINTAIGIANLFFILLRFRK